MQVWELSVTLISRTCLLHCWLACLSSYPGQDCNLRLTELWILFVSCWICCAAWVFTLYPQLSLSKQENWWFSPSALPFSNFSNFWAGLAGATRDKKSTNPGILTRWSSSTLWVISWLVAFDWLLEPWNGCGLVFCSFLQFYTCSLGESLANLFTPPELESPLLVPYYNKHCLMLTLCQVLFKAFSHIGRFNNIAGASQIFVECWINRWE